jgi:hypothetical protein
MLVLDYLPRKRRRLRDRISSLIAYIWNRRHELNAWFAFFTALAFLITYASFVIRSFYFEIR